MLDVTAKGKGVRVDPEKSGLVPKYSKKKEYGKTPTYLTRRKQEEDQAAVDYAQYVQSYQDQNSPYQVHYSCITPMAAPLRFNCDAH